MSPAFKSLIDLFALQLISSLILQHVMIIVALFFACDRSYLIFIYTTLTVNKILKSISKVR